jgi:hypothetical protein
MMPPTPKQLAGNLAFIGPILAYGAANTLMEGGLPRTKLSIASGVFILGAGSLRLAESFKPESSRLRTTAVLAGIAAGFVVSAALLEGTTR